MAIKQEVHVMWLCVMLSQHPVNPIKLTKNLEIPSDVLASRGLTRRQLEQEEEILASTTAQPPQRVKGETVEEKRARKQAVREMRKVRNLSSDVNRSNYAQVRDCELLNYTSCASLLILL